MPYASSSHVAALNTGRTFGASTKPTATQVAQYLQESAGVIDSILAGQGYVVPVTGAASTAQAVLEHYNALGAAFLVEEASQSSDRRDSAKVMWDWAQKMLDDVVLAGAATDTSEDAPGMPGGANSFPATPFFSRDMEF